MSDPDRDPLYYPMSPDEHQRRQHLQAELLEVERCRDRMQARLEHCRDTGRPSEVEFYRDMVDDLDHRAADILREVGR